MIAKHTNSVLFILDEWLLFKPADSESNEIFKLLPRREKLSNIFVLNTDMKLVMNNLEAMICHSMVTFLFVWCIINITSINASKDVSMREIYGLDKRLIE